MIWAIPRPMAPAPITPMTVPSFIINRLSISIIAKYYCTCLLTNLLCRHTLKVFLLRIAPA
ncbi:SWIM zinc finger family protein [Kiloniella laminariae]|uniref:SWIM zinc finger family protein n=1 Tax=Kiloniella laminariae TaxID=454162 RepID=UPI003CCBD3B4